MVHSACPQNYHDAMKKIGIVGGVAWPSTVDYYSEICKRSEGWHVARNPQCVPSTPEMSIEPLDFNKAVSYLGNDDDEESWSRFDDYHRVCESSAQWTRGDAVF